MTTPSHSDDRRVLLGRDIDDQLFQLRGLVLVRDLLKRRGESAEAIAVHTREIERQRRQLAEVIRGRPERVVEMVQTAA
jgi:hypothetical protein